MTANAIALPTRSAGREQYFMLPGCYTWQQFQSLKTSLGENTNLKISYLDGIIELMTTGEPHETISRVISLLLGLYFWHYQIEFTPVGSATRESETKEVSFAPDESYYIGQKKEHPDLAIEVIITSGNINKLEKYKRFKVREVWFWQKGKIAVYVLQNADNEDKIGCELQNKSELLPDLDLKMLAHCVLMPSKVEAMNEFLNHIQDPKNL
ncbi:MAG: Uma2 family endonuclease [Symploca sp. SIO2E6]|nr:Uma2 family endonuclease [Symploca sp. SIO2E6]